MKTEQLMVKMTFDRWNALLKSVDGIIDGLTDEQLQKQIAPGKNSGTYLLGHLIAVHDDMLILLNMGDKLFPQYNEPFIKSPDRSGLTLPSIQELRTAWKTMNETLAKECDSLKPEEWFEKHTAVSPEDFAKEPHRNKLNIIITRTSHLAYHAGQLVLMK